MYIHVHRMTFCVPVSQPWQGPEPLRACGDQGEEAAAGSGQDSSHRHIPVRLPMEGTPWLWWDMGSSASPGCLGKAGCTFPWKARVWIYQAACVKLGANLENVGAKMLPNTTQGKESGYT